MKASELTKDDVGKWVTLLGEIVGIVPNDITPVNLRTPDGDSFWLIANNILEFTDPPAPVQEVGDVFSNMGTEWRLAGIDGGKSWLRSIEYDTDAWAPFPLPSGYKFVRKGTPA